VLRALACGTVLAVALAAVPGAAQVLPPAADAVPSPSPMVENFDATVRILPLVTLSNRGSFRFRFNTFYRTDLDLPADTTVDPNAAPASSLVTPRAKSYDPYNDSVVSANMRLRWQPTLRVAEIVTVTAIVDVLDNLVLGTTPDVHSVSAPLSTFARGQRAPSAAFSAFRDSVRIKAAWAEVNLFDIVSVKGGRLPEHFGLGIVRNGGSDPDSDYGDYIDAVIGRVDLGITALRFGLEFPGEGVTSDAPYGYYALPYDMDQSDDTYRWVFGVDSTPTKHAVIDQRAKDFAAGKPVYDWGFYNAITQQKISSDRLLQGTGAAGTSPGLQGAAYDDYTIVPRGAFFWTPSLWGKLRMQPRPGLTFRLEAELAMTYGWVDHVLSAAEDEKSRKDFLSFGGALEADVDVGRNRVQLYAGAASGGNTLGVFGVNDGHILAPPGAGSWNREHASLYRTKDIHHFVFNRDYRVDSILFREIIGSITNAFYFKPAYDRVFLEEGDWKVGGGLSLLAAFACIPEGTPGGKRPLGVEGGLDLWMKWSRHLTIRADGAVLFPLEGLDRPGDGASPSTAAALRVRAIAEF
jgi:uncharacterized protein (TIGR04551 family)